MVGWWVVPWASAALFFVSWGLLWGHLRPGWGSSGVIFGSCGCHLGLFGAMGASSGVMLGLRGGHLCIFVGRRLPRGGRMGQMRARRADGCARTSEIHIKPMDFHGFENRSRHPERLEIRFHTYLRCILMVFKKRVGYIVGIVKIPHVFVCFPSKKVSDLRRNQTTRRNALTPWRHQYP